MRKTIFILLVVLISCNRGNNSTDEKPIARVFDKYLYASELKELIPENSSGNDSIEIVRTLVNNWIQQNIVLHKAEQNINEENPELNKQLEDYRNSLVIFHYEQELIRQQLDTIVTDDEIEEYYKKNQSNFELKDNIIKVVYVKLNIDAPSIKQVLGFVKSDDETEMEKLEDYCKRYAVNYFLDSDSWLLFADLLKEIPIKTYNEEEYLKNNTFIELKDSMYYYFVNIKGFRIKDSVSPLSFERDRIRNIIINKRKLELINQMKKDVFIEAQNENDFEIY
ncbi:MAG: hypothetical protein K9J13_15845 [Saprospiraceae bacterium]|nr:hypothetical protein [Saprospiraceae bacterium]